MSKVTDPRISGVSRLRMAMRVEIVSAAPLEFDGYEMWSAGGNFDPDVWDPLSDPPFFPMELTVFPDLPV